MSKDHRSPPDQFYYLMSGPGQTFPLVTEEMIRAGREASKRHGQGAMGPIFAAMYNAKTIMATAPDQGRINAAFDKLSDDLKARGLELHFDLDGLPRAKPSFETETDEADAMTHDHYKRAGR